MSCDLARLRRYNHDHNGGGWNLNIEDAIKEIAESRSKLEQIRTLAVLPPGAVTAFPRDRLTAISEILGDKPNEP